MAIWPANKTYFLLWKINFQYLPTPAQLLWQFLRANVNFSIISWHLFVEVSEGTIKNPMRRYLNLLDDSIISVKERSGDVDAATYLYLVLRSTWSYLNKLLILHQAMVMVSYKCMESIGLEMLYPFLTWYLSRISLAKHVI